LEHSLRTKSFFFTACLTRFVSQDAFLKDRLTVYTAPYPVFPEARMFVVPIVLKDQKHPKIGPAQREIWTNKERSTIGSVVAKKNRKACTSEEFENLVSGLFWVKVKKAMTEFASWTHLLETGFIYIVNLSMYLMDS
jgi:hypothetical protein